MNGCSNQLLNGLISWIAKVHLFVYQFLALLESMDQRYVFPNKLPLINVKHIERSFYHFKFFLSFTLYYRVGFGQILIQILMKKLGIRTFVIVSCWSINKTINFLSQLESSLSLVLSRGWDIFAEFKSYSGNLANIKKDFSWLKPILKKLFHRE